MRDNDDELVADYLARLRAAAARLSADRRDELVEDITAHIAEARATAPPAPGAWSPGPQAGERGGAAGVRNILERLGEPDDIVRATEAPPEADDPAAGHLVGQPDGRYLAGRAAAYPGGAGAIPLAARTGPGALEIVAVILLLVGGFIGGVGWVVGMVLLWSSPRWRIPDKLLATLVWPGGLAGAVLILAWGAIVSTGPHAVFIVVAALVGVVQIGVVIRLLHRAGRPAAVPAADPATLAPV